MGLLFLNNNLHHAHHARPGLAWYRLPGASKETGAEALAESGAGLYRGYWELARRHAFRPIDHPAGTVDA
jgi:fatty acid desaturase